MLMSGAQVRVWTTRSAAPALLLFFSIAAWGEKRRLRCAGHALHWFMALALCATLLPLGPVDAAVAQAQAVVADPSSTLVQRLPPTDFLPLALQGTAQQASQTAPITPVPQLPLVFVPNVGQTDARVRYVADTLGGKAFFTPSEIVLALAPVRDPDEAEPTPGPGDRPRRPRNIVRLDFLGATRQPTLVAGETLSSSVNFLIGNTPSAWKRNVPATASIRYQQLYPGIDLL